MFIMRSKWGVEFTGEPADLENITLKLNNSVVSADSLFVSRLNTLYVLRTGKWDSAIKASDVQILAIEQLAAVRGAIELLDTCGNLNVATIFELAEDGAIINQTRTTMTRLRTPKPLSECALPSEFRDIAITVETDENLRSALKDLKYETGWYEIYRITEALCRHYGGERNLLNAFPSEASNIARMKRTANSYRHIEGAFDPVANPMVWKMLSYLQRKF